jgi:hypothetical protein
VAGKNNGPYKPCDDNEFSSLREEIVKSQELRSTMFSMETAVGGGTGRRGIGVSVFQRFDFDHTQFGISARHYPLGVRVR